MCLRGTSAAGTAGTNRSGRRRWLGRLSLLLATCFFSAILPTPTRADEGAATPRWTLRALGHVGGTSSSSEPEGFEALSAIGLEAGLRRNIAQTFALELLVGFESREVDWSDAAGEVRSLGSLESMPVNLMFQFHPRFGGSWHPYLGAGANFTVYWEKTGELDSTDVSPSVGPAVQLGTDIDVASAMVLSLDIRWNLLETEIDSSDGHIATLKIHPMSFGAGVGVRF